jgi:phosphogluconate dehydratase
MHPEIQRITRAIIDRSQSRRTVYLGMIDQMSQQSTDRQQLSCGNLAHGFAGCSQQDKDTIKLMNASNVAIVTAYNDMLSAHAPYEQYPSLIKEALHEVGCTGQVAGGVPAMCDGVTQGQAGMNLSLMSRDVIAQSTAIALSHQMFDAMVLLGICDKIVPGLLMGALQFGHLPALIIPAGPMPSGLPNKEKARIRQLYAEGKADRTALLDAESASYHSQGTCTFYGTANSNQVMLEAMGLQLPGSSFVPPNSPLRAALTRYGSQQVTRLTRLNGTYTPLAQVMDARALINALVALLASGGSTNHCIHLIAIARAAGFEMNWSDFDAVSKVTPLLAKIYPNGYADVNHFFAAGGTGVLFNSLLELGLMHGDAATSFGGTLAETLSEPFLQDGKLDWRSVPNQSLDREVLAFPANPFASEGGIRLLEGNLGRSVIKTSAVADSHWYVSAPAIVIDSQHALQSLLDQGELNRDCVIVVRFQGPRANGMPELHKLTPILGVVQDRGFQVALVTDGRMSGASGKIPAAIHLTPEALSDGPIARLRDGDIITLDAHKGLLTVALSDEELANRQPAEAPEIQSDVGQSLFAQCRQLVSDAEAGASFVVAA